MVIALNETVRATQEIIFTMIVSDEAVGRCMELLIHVSIDEPCIKHLEDFKGAGCSMMHTLMEKIVV